MSQAELFDREDESSPESCSMDEGDTDRRPRDGFAGIKRRLEGSGRSTASIVSEDESDPEQPPPPIFPTPKRLCAYARKSSQPSIHTTPNRYSSSHSSAGSSATASENATSPLSSQIQSPGSGVTVRDQDLSISPGHHAGEEPCITEALSKITSLLTTVVKRVERVEAELKNKSSPATSSDSTSCSGKKFHVPRLVRAEVRKMYTTLMEESDTFKGFNLGIGFKFDSPENKEALAVIMNEVKTANPRFDNCQIRCAAYTYYRSLNQEESLRRRGKETERKQVRRRRERLLRKLHERQAALKKSTLPQSAKEKWSRCIAAELMSSEESDNEDDSIVVKPLPWRADKVMEFFHNLDGLIVESKTMQSKRQRKERVISAEVSSRPKPDVAAKFPKWAFKLN